jgi:hypothetical protein
MTVFGYCRFEKTVIILEGKSRLTAMTIIVIAQETDLYWYVIPKEFPECPTGPFAYHGQAALQELRKADWIIVGECSNLVQVTNSNVTHTINVAPKKIVRKQPMTS